MVEDRVAAIRDTLKENKNLDAIVVTGDIFDRDDFSIENAEYETTIKKAVDFFDQLFYSLGIEKKLRYENLFFVPGNHDIQRDFTSFVIHTQRLYNKEHIH